MLNRLEIEIDDTYSCPSNCQGCILSEAQRSIINNKPNLDFINISKSKINKYIKDLGGTKQLDITFGIGEHLFFDDAYLEHLYMSIIEIIQENNIEKKPSNVFFSTSLLLKTEELKKKLLNLEKIKQREGVQLSLLIVLDPKKLHKENAKNLINENINLVHEIMWAKDLAINLSDEAISKISPKELFDFCLEHKFKHIAINWVPTPSNLSNIYISQQKLANWIMQFDDLLDTKPELTSSFKNALDKIFKFVFNKTNSVGKKIELNFIDEVREHLSYNKNILIDKDGNIFNNYEAMGDIALSNTIPSFGSIYSTENIFELRLKNQLILEKIILKTLQKKPCVSCEFNKICATSGFFMYNSILNNNNDIKEKLEQNKKENSCYHFAKMIFEYYKPHYLPK